MSVCSKWVKTEIASFISNFYLSVAADITDKSRSVTEIH